MSEASEFDAVSLLLGGERPKGGDIWARKITNTPLTIFWWQSTAIVENGLLREVEPRFRCTVRDRMYDNSEKIVTFDTVTELTRHITKILEESRR